MEFHQYPHMTLTDYSRYLLHNVLWQKHLDINPYRSRINFFYASIKSEQDSVKRMAYFSSPYNSHHDCLQQLHNLIDLRGWRLRDVNLQNVLQEITEMALKCRPWDIYAKYDNQFQQVVYCFHNEGLQQSFEASFHFLR